MNRRGLLKKVGCMSGAAALAGPAAARAAELRVTEDQFGVLVDTTADTAFALMLAAARRVVEADRFVREGGPYWPTIRYVASQAELAALDDPPHIPGAADGARLVDADPDPRDVEFARHDLGDTLRQRLDELEARLADILLQALGNELVVEGVVDMVCRRSPGDIGSHLDIQYNRLPDLAFPLINSDDGIDPELFQEYNVHLLLCVTFATPAAY